MCCAWKGWDVVPVLNMGLQCSNGCYRVLSCRGDDDFHSVLFDLGVRARVNGLDQILHHSDK